MSAHHDYQVWEYCPNGARVVHYGRLRPAWDDYCRLARARRGVVALYVDGACGHSTDRGLEPVDPDTAKLLRGLVEALR